MNKEEPKFAPVCMNEDGSTQTCCENCGSVNLDFRGDDSDKCLDCGHIRYRV